MIFAQKLGINPIFLSWATSYFRLTTLLRKTTRR